MVYRRNSCIKGTQFLKKRTMRYMQMDPELRYKSPLSWLIQVHRYIGTSQYEFKWLNLLIHPTILEHDISLPAFIFLPFQQLHSQTIGASTSPEEFRAKPLRYNAFLGRQKASPTDLHRLDGNSGKPLVAMVRNKTHIYIITKGYCTYHVQDIHSQLVQELVHQ